MKSADTGLSVAPNLVDRVHAFNTLGQVTPPGAHFNADRVGFYLGMQLEELAETLKAIAAGHVDFLDRRHVGGMASMIDELGKDFKAGKHYGAVLRADREELLDGSIDSLVVTVGAMIYQTPRFREAIAAVLDANDAKFPNGVVVRDPVTQKIMKPDGWTAPDLAEFVDHPSE